MKARLICLGLLCGAFLLAMSLMVRAAPPVTSEIQYTQSMALPQPVMALTQAEPKTGPDYVQADSLLWQLVQDTGRTAEAIAPRQHVSYHVAAFYAFHYSDEAG